MGWQLVGEAAFDATLVLQSCVLNDLPHARAWHQATGSSPRPRDSMSSPAVTLLWRREWPHRRSSLLVLLSLLVLSVSSVQRLHEPKGQSKEPPPAGQGREPPRKGQGKEPPKDQGTELHPKGWLRIVEKNIYAFVE